MQTSDLIAQIQNLAAEHDALQADAACWRQLQVLTAQLGYGPRITPALIAEMLPNVNDFQNLIAATQEVAPKPFGAKFPRRKLTAEDERHITARAEAGLAPEQIASDLGLSLKSVVAFLERD